MLESGTSFAQVSGHRGLVGEPDPQKWTTETGETTYPSPSVSSHLRIFFAPAPKGLLEMMFARSWEVHGRVPFLLTSELSIHRHQDPY